MRSVSFHGALLCAHILSAAITVGATVSYAVWIALAERQPEHLAFTIRAVLPQSFAVGKTATLAVVFDVSTGMPRGNLLAISEVPRVRVKLDEVL